MSDKTDRIAKPAIITVGELISELCRCPDQAAVTFRCSLEEEELRFYRCQTRSRDVVEIELAHPGRPPVLPSSHAS